MSPFIKDLIRQIKNEIAQTQNIRCLKITSYVCIIN